MLNDILYEIKNKYEKDIDTLSDNVVALQNSLNDEININSAIRNFIEEYRSSHKINFDIRHSTSKEIQVLRLMLP